MYFVPKHNGDTLYPRPPQVFSDENVGKITPTIDAFLICLGLSYDWVV